MKTRDHFQHSGPARYHHVFLYASIRRWALGVRSSAFASSVRLQSAFFRFLRPTAYSLQPTVGGLQAAFTLIEVLVAMTVLSIMVLMVANIFQSSSAAWNIGTQKADMNTAARAALDFMARELACAVAGEVEAVSLATPTNILFRLEGGTNVIFIALSGDLANGRALRGIRFQHDNVDRILRHERGTGFNPYTNSGSWSGGGLQPLVTNVWSLNMYAFANESDLNGGVGTPDYTSSSLPLCLDIAVEMLSGDDMMRAIALNSDPSAQTNFVARNSKLYSTRVYFPNRAGYGGH